MDSELSITLDLANPVRSFRLFAIEQAIREGASPEILAAIQKQLLDEKDDECKILLNHARVEVQRRLEGQGNGSAGPAFDPASFFERFSQATIPERLQMLARLSPRVLSDLGQTAVKLLENEENPVVAAGLIKTFSRAWPSEHFSRIASQLSASHLTLRLAAMEMLLQRAPDMLVQDLPALLISRDPRERALAIRGLAAIDFDEALAHLEALLLSNDPARKQAGLQNCIFLPFERVKPLLFKFFASESDPALLERAGWLFEINPDPEVPFHLYEIAELARPEKAAIVKKILSGACRVVEKTELLGDGFKAYIAKLQNWIFRRSATRFVHECAGRLAGETDPGPEFEASIRKNLEKAHIRGIFEEALTWPIPERARQRMAILLEKAKSFSPEGKRPPAPSGSNAEKPSRGNQFSPPPAANTHQDMAARGTLTVSTVPLAPPPSRRSAIAPAKLPALPATSSGSGDTVSPGAADLFENLSGDDKIRRVAAWQPEERDLVAVHLAAIVKNPSSSPDLAATALRTAARIESEGLVEAAGQWLRNADPNPVSAALEYLARFDAERIFPMLGKFLQSPHPRVKTGALKILKRFDPPQAASMLKAMLSKKSLENQTFALGCMIHVDFSLVRDHLAAYLEANPGTPHFESALCLFQANPDPENLYILYRLEKKLPGPEAALRLRAVREETIRLVRTMGLVPVEKIAQLESGFADRFKREQEKSKAPPAAYTIRVLREKEEAREGVSAFLRELVRRYWFVPVTAAVLVGLWMYFFPAVEIASKPIKPGGLLAIPVDIRGTVVEIRSKRDELVILTDDGVTVILPIPRGPAWRPRLGNAVKATVTPIRLIGEKVIAARTPRIERP
ncbi:MAG: HEAT repeat domain-containing protein [Candidatus Ozemobacteraceae bacterium]